MMTQQKASSMLSDVDEQSNFRLHMGTSIVNLRQLSEALDIMADDSFRHHVDSTKNDFANWIRHAIGDEELARSIEKTTSRRKISAKVRRRLDYLERKKTQNIVCNRDFLTCGASDFVLGAVIGFVIGMIFAVIL